MTKFASIAAAAALTALFAGNAMAQMPASGEGPLFLDEAKAVSTVARDSVRNEAVAQRPASGAFDGQTVAKSNAGLTRAEVRAQAIANPPASGVFDGSTVAEQSKVKATNSTAQAQNAKDASKTAAGE